MKKHILLVFINLVIFSSLSIAQKRFVLENPALDRFQVYDHIDSAINNLQEGDRMTIPGGIYSPSPTWKIDVPDVQIIGRGFFEDSTSVDGPTKIAGSIVIAASGVQISGLHITTGLSTTMENGQLSNLIIERCYIQSHLNLAGSPTAPGTVNALIRQNLILNNLTGGFTQSALISHNVIGRTTTQFEGNSAVVFRNNLFLANGGSSVVFSAVNQCRFENNLFSTGSFNSNVFSSSSNNLGFGNSFNITGTGVIEKMEYITNIFYNSHRKITFVNNSSNFPSFNSIPIGTFDLRLADGQPAVGPFAGPSAVPAGWVPRGPHIQSAEIATETDAEGRLQINIKVRAQQN